jgi:FAD/FMN-containing dehydrogenase
MAMVTTVGNNVFGVLRSRFSGALIRPDDSEYDETRTVFNAMVDKHPALIARCHSANDVVAAVDCARECGLELAIRSGGHAVTGASSSDGGLVIDLRPMNQVAVNPARRLARVGAGATWGDFDAAAQEFGLATTGGRVSTTGVSGLTLGGGSGWLERKYGLACDNLVSAEVVTADGRVVTANETVNPDLFWALHGGGGNFGVVTSLEFRLHPVGPTVLAGLLLWPGAAGPELVRFYRDFAESAPDELGSAVGFLTGPPAEFVPRHLRGMICAAVVVCYCGPVGEGERVLKALRSFGPPDADLVQPMPYTGLQSMLDDANRAGLRNYWTADYLDELSDEAVDTFAEQAFRMGSPHSQCLLFPWGGAVARIGEDATPLARRGSAWVAHPMAMWTEPDEDAEHTGWAREFSAAMRPFVSGGVYLNFIGDEGEDRIRAAYGTHHGRLRQIKAKYDPDNLFHLNQNITP